MSFSYRINYGDFDLEILALEDYAERAISRAVSGFNGSIGVTTQAHKLNALAVDCVRVNGYTVIMQDSMINVFTGCSFVGALDCVTAQAAKQVFLSLTESFTNVTNAR